MINGCTLKHGGLKAGDPKRGKSFTRVKLKVCTLKHGGLKAGDPKRGKSFTRVWSD